MKSLIVLVTLALTGCASNPNEVLRVLETAGYTKVELKGYSYFGCSDGDVFRTAFVAKAPNGQYVEGTVCAGWFKGSVIRID